MKSERFLPVKVAVKAVLAVLFAVAMVRIALM